MSKKSTSLEEIRKLNDKDLEQELQKDKFGRLKVALQVRTKQSNNTAALKDLRKRIARIKTIKRMHAIEKLKENSKGTVTK